jgi:chemotaxis protein CheZ
MTEIDTARLAATLAEVKQQLEFVQSEIASIRHPKATEDRLNAASLELDAIVQATEKATNGILGLAEKIADEAAKVSGAEKIAELAEELFTECAFQDITGQRVGKVITTLTFVDERIGSIIDLFGDEFHNVPVPDHGPADADANLLNGPQLNKPGVSQSDIDAMFG